MDNSYKQKKDWEKEFDKKFPVPGKCFFPYTETLSHKGHWLDYGVECGHDDGILCEWRMKKLKDFISSLIDETEKQAYEKGLSKMLGKWECSKCGGGTIKDSEAIRKQAQSEIRYKFKDEIEKINFYDWNEDTQRMIKDKIKETLNN